MKKEKRIRKSAQPLGLAHTVFVSTKQVSGEKPGASSAFGSARPWALLGLSVL